MTMDIATRVYNHTFKIDPIIRSVLDTDFYKLLMAQMIFKLHRDRKVTFGVMNRSRTVRLADVIDERELREQLDHARTVGLTKGEEIWLTGNTFYGRKQIFEPAFVDWLRAFRLPDYDLRRLPDGQFELHFEGPWVETTMWEVPALAILNELKSRAVMRPMGRFELDVLYARAKAKLWEKVERLRRLASEGTLKVGDFGTRRRHGYLWQQWAVSALMDGLGPEVFTGTSNVLLAMRLDTEAIGTNAHELPMVYAALANSDEELRQAPYKVLRDWESCYSGNLLIVLPDAFGTTAFLRDAPDWVADWTGARPDSKPPIEGTREWIEWWQSKGRNPKDKLIILSDGLDVDTIESSIRALRGDVRLAVGWGTKLTNDFRGCSPNSDDGLLAPISVVCKVIEADGRPCVKISDNPEKAMGPKSEIDRYLRVFGSTGMARAPVEV